MRFVAAVAVLLALLAGACAGKPKPPPEPALTAVHSEALRARMGQLRQVAIEDLSVATKAPTVRRDLANVAFDLEQIASKLPDIVDQLELDEDQRSHFVLFADSLGASAIRLGEAAPAASGAVVQERIDEVANACAGCHWAFRAGPSL